MEKKICCICGKEFEGWGNNPSPIKEEGECCDDCNIKYVFPARMAELKKVKITYELTPKERVEEFLQECELFEEETDKSAEELPCYKALVRDLEVLNILKKKLDTYSVSLTIKNNTLSAIEFNKVKEWLDN